MIKNKIKYLIDGELKKPSEIEIDRLVESYALKEHLKKKKVFVESYNSLLKKMERKYPYIRFNGEHFETNIYNKSIDWWDRNKELYTKK
jgi:hypothetical protein